MPTGVYSRKHMRGTRGLKFKKSFVIKSGNNQLTDVNRCTRCKFTNTNPKGKTMSKFNWYAPTQYDAASKRRFHANGRARLRKLADALGLDPGTYAIRSNQGGIAVSGEVILHGEHVYVHVSQPYSSGDTGVLYRRCNGREDYTGARNHFASLAALNSIEALAAVIERDLGPCYKPNANEVQS
jgi:hypothetical protein